MSLCKLADAQFRLSRASENDRSLISSLLLSEQQRLDKSTRNISLREQKIKQLTEGGDEAMGVDGCLSKLQSELSTRSAALSDAEKAEEEAKRVRFDSRREYVWWFCHPLPVYCICFI